MESTRAFFVGVAWAVVLSLPFWLLALCVGVEGVLFGLVCVVPVYTVLYIICHGFK